jgi:hypothetical protein
MLAARHSLRTMAIRSASALGLDASALAWATRGGARAQVMNFHGTPAAQTATLRAQLEWVGERFVVLDLDAFARVLRSGARLDRPALLLTFDDGIASNYHVAAPALEAMGMRGLFFVNPGFAESRGESARVFYMERLLANPSTRPAPEEWMPMSPDQIGDLAKRGHAIGNHTYSHADLSRTPATELEHQIVRSRDRLREWTGTPVDSFAWTYRWDAITPVAWEMARAAHPLCFAPCSGSVRPGRSRPDLIWRTHMEGDYPEWEYRFIYSGLGAIAARGKRRRLHAILDAPVAGSSLP